MPLEKDVEGRVVHWWEKIRGLPTTKLNGQNNRGKPDRVFWAPNGTPVIIEFKAPGEKPSKLQEHHLAQFYALGYAVAWYDEAEPCIEYLEQFL